MIDLRLTRDIDNGEGCKLVAYRDTKNLWTIGWGHLLDQSKDWTGLTWTQQYADTIRDQDIQKAIDAAQNLQEYPSLDTPCRQNAVCELVFNMGEKRWKGFVKCRAAIVRKDWQIAHDQLLASEWNTEVGKTRATRLSQYLLTGQYPT